MKTFCLTPLKNYTVNQISSHSIIKKLSIRYLAEIHDESVCGGLKFNPQGFALFSLINLGEKVVFGFWFFFFETEYLLFKKIYVFFRFSDISQLLFQ